VTRFFALTAGETPTDALDAIEARGLVPVGPAALYRGCSVGVYGAVETMEPVAPSLVVAEICRARGLKPSDVRGPKRLAEFVRARVAIAKTLRAAGCSLPEIARALGGRDHTSVMYYLGMVRRNPKRTVSPGVRRVA
jgi:hypothetical protein